MRAGQLAHLCWSFSQAWPGGEGRGGEEGALPWAGGGALSWRLPSEALALISTVVGRPHWEIQRRLAEAAMGRERCSCSQCRPAPLVTWCGHQHSDTRPKAQLSFKEPCEENAALKTKVRLWQGVAQTPHLLVSPGMERIVLAVLF